MISGTKPIATGYPPDVAVPIRCLIVTPYDPLTGGPRTGPLRRYLNPPRGVSYGISKERFAYPRKIGYYKFAPSGVGLAALRFFLERLTPLGQRRYSLIHSFFWDPRKFEVPWIHESDQSFGQFLSGYNAIDGFVKRMATEGFSVYLNSRRCRGVITWSEWARRGFQEDGVDPSKVSVIPPPFDPLDDKREHSGCNVLFLGRDYKRKGGDVAVKAFEAASRLPDAKLIYVGKIDDMAVRRKVLENRRIMYVENPSNAVLEEEIWPVTDVLLLPTRTDAFAMAVAEAMRRAIPVVTSSLPAIVEVVEDRVSGLLAQPGDAGMFKRNLELLLGNPELRVDMGGHARARSTALFSTEKVNHALRRVYEDALQLPSRRPE